MSTLETMRDEIPTALEKTSALGAALLEGPPGTGKTTLCHMLADSLGLPAYVLHSHPDMMQGEMLMSYAPNSAGVWGPVYKPVLQAWGYGPTGQPGVLIVDDVHIMGPGGMAALYVAMDGARGASMTLDDGTLISPKPGYRCLLTMNGSHTLLDEPIRDRLWSVFQVMAPSTAMFARLTAEIRDLAEIDYDGRTAQPAATYREWLAMSEMMGILPLGQAVRAVLGSVDRARGMLVTMAAAGIHEAETAVAALAAEMPSGAPVGGRR